jgi:hypothetical protein
LEAIMARPAPLLPAALCRWLEPALAVFSPRGRAQTAALAMGALLAIGPRIVTNILHVLGLAGRADFSRFHRVLSRNTWSGLAWQGKIFGTASDISILKNYASSAK